MSPNLILSSGKAKTRTKTVVLSLLGLFLIVLAACGQAAGIQPRLLRTVCSTLFPAPRAILLTALPLSVPAPSMALRA